MLDLSALLDATTASGATAAFDADGTLWADDIGDAFLRELEQVGLVAAGAFRTYEDRLASDPVDAYGFCVTAMAGVAEGAVREMAASFYARHFDKRLFPPVRRLLDTLLDGGVEVAIVSASNRWLIEAAAKRLGVKHFAGVEVEIEQGRLTDRLVRPLPSGEGKVHWARSLLGKEPALAVGNGTIDLDLLRSASHRLVICPADDLHTPLATEGRKAGWPVLAVEHPCAGEPLP